jgi:FkbM family methyltransferase
VGIKAYQLLGRIKWGVALQPVYEAVLGVALTAMNVGPGNTDATSGETFVLHGVKARHAGHAPVVVFDVGANVGHYTAHVIDIFGDAAHIYAFEPSPSTYALLARNVAPHSDTVHAYNVGLGSTDGPAPFFQDEKGGSTIASLYESNLARGYATVREEIVMLRTIDAFCREEGIMHIDFLKIDVEGHELDVLRGARVMIESGAIDLIQFEFGMADIGSRTFLRDFFDFFEGRYRLYRVVRNGLYPLPRYREIYEVFFNSTNYVAERLASQ